MCIVNNANVLLQCEEQIDKLNKITTSFISAKLDLHKIRNMSETNDIFYRMSVIIYINSKVYVVYKMLYNCRE